MSFKFFFAFSKRRFHTVIPCSSLSVFFIVNITGRKTWDFFLFVLWLINLSLKAKIILSYGNTSGEKSILDCLWCTRFGSLLVPLALQMAYNFKATSFVTINLKIRWGKKCNTKLRSSFGNQNLKYGISLWIKKRFSTFTIYRQIKQEVFLSAFIENVQVFSLQTL